MVVGARLEELPDARVVVLVGSGGNGGDALFAAAELAGESSQASGVVAILLGEHAHEPALDAARSAGVLLVEATTPQGVAEAHAAGWRVVVKEGVANGRLTARGVTGGGDVPAVLAAEAGRLGVTPDAVALAAALQQPWAAVVLSGASTQEQLRENLRAFGLKVDLAALGTLAQSPETYWQERSALAWT